MTRELLIQDYETARTDLERASRMNTPSMMLLPKLTIDGDHWCALFGDSLHDGVAGFGDSPDEAYYDFDKAWFAKLPRIKSEVRE